MRVIAGTRRRRKLKSPKDDAVSRPITDRVKQAMFDRLYMAGMLDGGNALDIFSGVGSLGIEAMSRGIDHCTFVERSPQIRSILEENLTMLEFRDQIAVGIAEPLVQITTGAICRGGRPRQRHERERRGARCQ